MEEKCRWCYHGCSQCAYCYKNELGVRRCGKYPDSEHFKSLAEYDQGCRHWVCYRTPIEERKEEE